MVQGKAPQTLPTEKAAAQKSFVELWPPGHYYSVLPNLAETAADAQRLYDFSRKEFPGIDLRGEQQLALLRDFRDKHAPAIPYQQDVDGSDLRFTHTDNRMYGYKDAAVLFCFLHKFRPKQVIEVGSGFSSAVMLDVNDRFLSQQMKLTFIDPYPQRLQKLIHPRDAKATTIIPRRVQDVPLSTFDTLSSNDILFIDSSHVSKLGSDVNYEIFEVLPRLRPGVLVHFHDIFFPFEYPRSWTEEGRAWNEAYALRAFLQFNSSFEIMFFTSYLWNFYRRDFGQHWLFAAEAGSRSSIWLRRTS